ncbi:MAG: hypothetical protein QM639_17950 [Rhodocyclaceae bacterium]
MLPRETAYRLAGRHHRSPLGSAPDTLRIRHLRLAHDDDARIEQAARLLNDEPGMAADHLGQGAFVVRYDLVFHSLQAIEQRLHEAGLTLADSLYMRAWRAVVYFAEDTQRRNLAAPQRLIKRSDEVYVKAHALHPHGDHDDTPPDLREER